MNTATNTALDYSMVTFSRTGRHTIDGTDLTLRFTRADGQPVARLYRGRTMVACSGRQGSDSAAFYAAVRNLA